METKFRIAVATVGKKGLEDKVSEVFGRANTFTILEVQDWSIKEVKIIENPAISYEHGAGPIAVKELVDSNVGVVITPPLGYGASSILEHHDVKTILAEAGIRVAEAVKDALEELHKK